MNVKIIPRSTRTNQTSDPFSCSFPISSGRFQNRQKAAGQVEPVGGFVGFLFITENICLHSQVLVNMRRTCELEGQVVATATGVLFCSVWEGYFMDTLPAL